MRACRASQFSGTLRRRGGNLDVFKRCWCDFLDFQVVQALGLSSLTGFPGRVELSSVIHSVLLLSKKPSIEKKRGGGLSFEVLFVCDKEKHLHFT